MGRHGVFFVRFIEFYIMDLRSIHLPSFIFLERLELTALALFQLDNGQDQGQGQGQGRGQGQGSSV
jgi:hypothetical protein